MTPIRPQFGWREVIALALMLPSSGYCAWRVGEKRRKRLQAKVVLQRIVISPIMRRILGR